MSTSTGTRATFTSFETSTREDWDIIMSQQGPLMEGLPDRLLDHLRLLDNDFGGFPVDRLTHSVQTAARAEADGRDEEYLVCALFHDIGDMLTPYNHPDLAAAILKPFVSPANHFMVQNHGVFQGYYFWHHIDRDQHAREKFRGHEWFEHTEEFCAKYDQLAFDPDYPTPPLSYYEPLVAEFFAPKTEDRRF